MGDAVLAQLSFHRTIYCGTRNSGDAFPKLSEVFEVRKDHFGCDAKIDEACNFIDTYFAHSLEIASRPTWSSTSRTARGGTP